jgi:hypothetical protein
VIGSGRRGAFLAANPAIFANLINRIRVVLYHFVTVVGHIISPSAFRAEVGTNPGDSVVRQCP